MRISDMSILVADSGGTKTDWAAIHSSGTEFFSGKGLHPAYNTVDEMAMEISSVVKPAPDKIKAVYFYGAGCHGDQPRAKVSRAFEKVLPGSKVTISDDLTGAARAHFQQSEGIIAALGTGSICGRYSGGEIVQRSAALGYAIGDEGSAADIGKAIIRQFLRNRFDSETHQTIKKKLGNADYSYWMEKIYGSRQPNRELASVAGLVLGGKNPVRLPGVLKDRFERFITVQLSTLNPDENENIVFTGTVSTENEELILRLLKERNFRNCSVRSGHIKGLVTYHKNG